jgi:hypothetical protein
MPIVPSFEHCHVSANLAPMVGSMHVHPTLITTNTTSAAQLVKSGQKYSVQLVKT